MALNLERQLLFYGSYHHEPVNVWIHITCVPVILITSFMMLGWASGPLYTLPASVPQIPHLPPNLGTIGAFLYSTLYILMEPVAGGLATPLMLAATAAANRAAEQYGLEAIKWAGAAWTVSWVLQFVGHGKFEGRAPALLDNLVQAFFLAPLFVWLEILFMLGYRPELQARIEKGVQKEIEKFRSEKEEEKKKKKALAATKTGNGKATNGKAKA